MGKAILIYLLVINVVAFIVYGRDKRRAGARRRRTPESTLLLLAFAGGAGGALLAMRHYRHKTKHWKFIILVPLACGLWIAALVWWFF